MNQIVGGLDGVCTHSYVYLILYPSISYIDPISIIDMVIRSYMSHRGYSDILFSEFENDFECTIFDQPYRNPYGAQNDTQMEYIWASHETKRIDGPVVISKYIQSLTSHKIDY